MRHSGAGQRSFTSLTDAPLSWLERETHMDTRRDSQSRMWIRRRQRRSVRTAVLGTLILVGVLAGAHIDAWADCPSPDPDADYNCPLGPTYVLPGWTNGAGWTQPAQYQTIKLGDLDGDGKDELIGRDPSGLSVYSFNTTRGLWEPVVRTDGKGLLILPLSDAAGYGPPQYSTTIQLADVDGQPGKELIVRSPNGLLVFKFVKGTLPGGTFQAGSWQQLNASGPFADTATFSNGKNWGSDVAYYSTIRLADIDGQPGAEAIGWGGNGVEAWKWNGTGWTQLTGIPGFGDAIVHGESEYSTLQLADLDGQPGAELIFRSAAGAFENGGLHVLQYQPGSGGGGGAWSELVNTGPFATDGLSVCGTRSCWATIRSGDVDGDGIAEVVGRLDSGDVQVYKLTASSSGSQWTLVGTSPGLLAGPQWSQPSHYETVQLADIDGQPGAELVTNNVDGIVVYRWSSTTNTFSTLTVNVPNLAADPWSTDRSYWATIQAGDVDGDKKAELLARGPYGVRTWRYQADQNTWSRYVPAGAFPQFTGVEATAYTALNQFLGIETGSVRDAYTDPTRNPTANELKNFQDAIAGRCSGEILGAPPRYQRCSPPSGSVGFGIPAYTAVSNQIIAELFWAQHVIDYFSTLGNLTTNLFLDENSSFPSLAADLKLDSEGVTGQTKATVDYTTLVLNQIANVLKFAGSFVGPDGAPLVVAGNALAVVIGVDSFLFNPTNPSSGGATFDHAFADVQKQVAIIQQDAQDLLAAQQHRVLSDANLLTAVGTLVNSQLWTLDTAGALSVSRQQFALWALQSFLPQVWDRWVITRCTVDTNPFTTDCNGVDGLGGGLWLRTTDAGVSFTAVLPKQEPCAIQGVNKVCEWTHVPSDTMTTLLFNPISASCTYQPGTTNSWVYGRCSLGLGFANWDVNGILDNKNGWSFATRVGSPVPGPEGSITSGEASAVGTPRQGRLKLSAEIPVLDPLDLRTAVLTLDGLLEEINGAGELVNDHTGNDLSPLVLVASRGARATEGEFTTPRGQLPQVTVRLKVDGDMLDVRLQVDRASIQSPGKCAGLSPTTRLQLTLRVDDLVHPPVELITREHWACETNHGGRVTGLHFP